ncbi:helix-turn-helix domain-containing protein [Chitinophaga sp. 22321]|uniref:AraC family transcriptional regulator n=1 Tax=Chitinophaga hostae TaxID=2831022 RepID=A0ABS5IW69_9BACT|nr:helix-turn-helix domain-containing protein [Chitinophaga hostae]MBS0027214.1 AraC family transcriptional regulator [Chitinophaga hostae]
MHVQLIAILDRKLEDSVLKYSRLPFHTTALNSNLYSQILHNGAIMLKNRLDFLNAVNLIPVYNRYYKQEVLIYHNLKGSQSRLDKIIEGEALTAIQQTITDHLKRTDDQQNRVIPIFQHYSSSTDLMLLTGISILDKESSTAVSLIHQLGMPLSMVEFTIYKPVYLTQLLDIYQKKTDLSVKALATMFGKSYKQVQKDSKLYFGTTLYNFVLKLKMLDTIDDLMFTDLTLKEIAFKNNFADYGSMYKLFSKQYNFPLQQIPRFLTLI